MDRTLNFLSKNCTKSSLRDLRESEQEYFSLQLLRNFKKYVLILFGIVLKIYTSEGIFMAHIREISGEIPR